MDTKTIVYNIYYSTAQIGPWTLANPTPITEGTISNTYTITGLTKNTKYYIKIVGGYLDDSSDFIPLVSQPIAETVAGASNDNALRPISICIQKVGN